MPGKTLVTQQTRSARTQVNRLHSEDGADIDRELYLSILVDRETGQISFVVSTECGIVVEMVSKDTPEKIKPLPLPPLLRSLTRIPKSLQTPANVPAVPVPKANSYSAPCMLRSEANI